MAAEDGSAVPSPANATSTPSIGEPPPSVTWTTTESGSGLPGGPTWPSPDATSTAAGSCRTVTDAESLNPWNEATTVASPFATAVTTPLPSAWATRESLLDHATAPG